MFHGAVSIFRPSPCRGGARQFDLYTRRLTFEPLEGRRLLSSSPIPMPDHVVMVIEENHSYQEIIGSASAPYINSLADGPNAALFTKSYAVEHPSQPNYLDLFSGSNQGVTSDNVPANLPFTTANLGAELIAQGYSFGGYSESMPSVGFQGSSYTTVPGQNQYVSKHNPWVDWQNATSNAVPASDNMPLTSFPANFSALPTFSIIVPNEQDDMHDGTISEGDTWLKNNLASYVQWAQTHNSLLIVTFDEDDSSETNQIPTLLVGPMVKQGQYNEQINHYNVLRTLEDMYGLPYAGNSATAATISDVWTFSTSTVLSASPDSPVYGQAVTLTATVGASPPGAGLPGGTVQFQIDGTNFGQPVSLTNGVAAITASDLAAGNHSVTAIFSSDSATFNGSTAEAINVAVAQEVLTIDSVQTMDSLEASNNVQVVIGAGGDLTVNNPVTLDSDGVLSAVQGGRVTLPGINSLPGATGIDLDSGTLRASADFSTTAPITIGASGGTIDSNGCNLVLAGALTAPPGGSIMTGSLLVHAAPHAALAVTGPAGLIVTGSGIVTLSGTNSYQNGTVVQEGTLVVESASSLPDNTNLSIGSGGTLIFGSTPLSSPATATSPTIKAVATTAAAGREVLLGPPIPNAAARSLGVPTINPNKVHATAAIFAGGTTANALPAFHFANSTIRLFITGVDSHEMV